MILKQVANAVHFFPSRVAIALALLFVVVVVEKQSYRTWLPYTHACQTHNQNNRQYHTPICPPWMKFNCMRERLNDWLAVYCSAFSIYTFLERRKKRFHFHIVDFFWSKKKTHTKFILFVCFHPNPMFEKVIWICFVSRLITVITAAHAVVVEGGRWRFRKKII